MDHLAEHRKILERAAANKLPDRIGEGSELSAEAFRELYEQGFVAAIDVSSDDGRAYLEPRATIAGREYLNELQRRESEKSAANRLKRAAIVVGAWIGGIVATILGAWLLSKIGLKP